MPETRDDRGRTALHIAAINNQVDITRYLLKCNSDVEAIDNDGRTPLHFALSGGDSKPMQSICRLLLDHHAAADVQDSNG
ncbi:MAG: ankyrin repeat domain-containing protein, partial [Chloroflexi bacterium]|nr:ankyrin repeat domain-containing protein [Chloroflexota bacterium]